MSHTSIFNHVLGPVMHGPSSSHTAGAHRIGQMVRAIAGEPLARVRFTFDPSGSYAQVFREQGADLSFAAGLMGLSMTDPRFGRALEEAASAGLRVEFEVGTLDNASHPNSVRVEAQTRSGAAGSGRRLEIVAGSTGGGAIEVIRINRHAVWFGGFDHALLVACDREALPRVERQVTKNPLLCGLIGSSIYDDTLITLQFRERPGRELESRLRALPGVARVTRLEPILFMPRGKALFESAAEMVDFARREGISLGQAGLRYEAEILGLTPRNVLEEMDRRLEVMLSSVHEGLRPDARRMQLLDPTAHRVMAADARGSLPLGGLHTRAAARAMAVMHVNGAMGIVCAAPTAGSAGVIPAVAATLLEECGWSREQVLLGLLAAGAVGVIVAKRATFAAEECGCQVEIGAAGAMAAAMVVDVVSGSAQQACDAAAIALQNTMGSVCDLVQGAVEIPCHTRNAAAASSAFVCADLIMGGYGNPVPLDDTIDASAAAGRMLPSELRCTARGGLAVTPAALALERRPPGSP